MLRIVANGPILSTKTDVSLQLRWWGHIQKTIVGFYKMYDVCAREPLYAEVQVKNLRTIIAKLHETHSTRSAVIAIGRQTIGYPKSV